MYKKVLLNVLQIMQGMDDSKPLLIKDIIEILHNEYRIDKVNRKSISENLHLLIDEGYPIEKVKGGWIYRNDLFEDWQVKMMMDAIQQTKCISAKEADEILKKIIQLTSPSSKKRLDHIIVPKGNNQAKEDLGPVIAKLLKSMSTKKKIEFNYIKLNNHFEKELRKEGKVYKLNLYSIYFANNNYYLIGSHDHHEGLTNYRLDRIVNLKISDENIIEAREKLGLDANYVIDEYVNYNVNYFSGNLINIEMEYIPDQISNAILYDFIGEPIKSYKLDNGKYHISFTKMESVTLVGWFVQYANRFKVIKPERFRDKVIEELENGLKVYKN